MTSATEKELSDLHKKVAKVLLNQLESNDKAKYLLNEYNAELPEEVLEYLYKQTDASPALLTVVTKFLKDNNITAVVEEDETLSELDKRLAAKKQRRTVGNVIPIKEEDE